MNWNQFLGLTQANGSNGVVSTVSYDGYARPSVETLPTGAHSPNSDQRFPPNPITSFLIPISHRSEATLDFRL